MPSIEVSNLTKRFGNLTAVDNLSFKIKEGEVFGFLGPNGAGKTTTIRILATLMSPTEGSAVVGGYDILKEPLKVRETVGILTENPSLYERLSAYENLDFFAEAYGIESRKERQKKIQELLEFFGLWERRSEKVGNFSKGMKQKLSIARALVHEPPIIFLDEPTAGLDPAAAKEIRDLIEMMSHKEKRTILLCTHHLEDAQRLADRVLIINKGRNVALGTPEELEDRVGGTPQVEISLSAANKKIVAAVKSVKNVVKVSAAAGRLIISLKNPKSTTPEVVSAVVKAGGKILSVNPLRPSLEDAYMKLMGEKNENS